MEPAQRPAVVLDCGSGYTKLGFAGNTVPTFVFPTALSINEDALNGSQATPLSDLAYAVGDDAISGPSPSKRLVYPVRYGLIEDWDSMELLWQHCIHQYMRVDPEDHYFLLTEPPLNPPENREHTAEVMFETHNVPGLFIGMQASLALYSPLREQAQAGGKLTGAVVDVGEGCTHVVPVVDGYVVSGAIRSIPMAGRDVTRYVQHLLRKRGAGVPPEMSLDVARVLKERHCYACRDMGQEAAKHAADPLKYRKQYSGYNPSTGREFTVEIGDERYLAPEIFFSPDIYTSSPVPPLPQLVDSVIQSCPIDTRRDLYRSVVLSGGTTTIRGFGHRLHQDLESLVKGRMAAGAAPVEVQVRMHGRQHFAVWLGGSILAMAPTFPSICYTREQYEEHGPSICRGNLVFKDAV